MNNISPIVGGRPGDRHQRLSTTIKRLQQEITSKFAIQVRTPAGNISIHSMEGPYAKGILPPPYDAVVGKHEEYILNLDQVIAVYYERPDLGFRNLGEDVNLDKPYIHWQVNPSAEKFYEQLIQEYCEAVQQIEKETR